MGQTFAAIPTRNNGDDVDAGWWNILQQAGQNLEQTAGGGSGSIAETQFTFANSQVAAANVTGLSFDHTVNKSFEATIAARLYTATAELYAIIKLFGRWQENAASWALTQEDHGDATGLTFSITAAGQVQYTSGTVSGTGYSGASRFKATAFGT